MKRIAVCFLIVVCSIINLHAQQIPKKPEPARFVNDYAAFLKVGEVRQLERQLKAYSDSTSTQIVIVGIETLGGDNLEDYSLKLAQTWGIGQKGKDNGLLILLVKSERKIRLEVGYGLEADIPDAFAQYIIDEKISPKFKQRDFYGGLSQAISTIFSALDGTFTADDYQKQEQGKQVFWSRLAVYIPTSILFIVILAVSTMNKHLKLGKLRAVYSVLYIAFIGIVESYYFPHYQAGFMWNLPAAVCAIGAYPFFITFRQRDKAYTLYYTLSGRLNDSKEWDELRKIYFPEEVNAKQQELQQTFAPLEGKAKELKVLNLLHKQYSEFKNKPEKALTRRNDADFRELLLDYRVQRHLRQKAFTQDSRDKVAQEIENFETQLKPYSLNPMPKEVSKVLAEGVKFLEILRDRPENVLDVNVDWTQAEIKKFLDNDKTWEKYKTTYTEQSIKLRREKLKKTVASLEDKADKNAWYHFFRQSIEKMKANPQNFLVKIKVSGSGGSGGSSYSSSSSSRSSSSSSSFGGGSFGGGGASGGW